MVPYGLTSHSSASGAKGWRRTVTAKMDAVKMAKYTGDIPQNVNFALKASLVRDMLEVKDIDYETASSKRELKTVDIFDKAKKFTVLVECLQ